MITWFSGGTEGDQSLLTEYEGGDFWKLTAPPTKGGGVHKNITEP